MKKGKIVEGSVARDIVNENLKVDSYIFKWSGLEGWCDDQNKGCPT